MIKSLHLGWSSTPHTARWVSALKKRDHEVALISYGGEPLAGVVTYNLPQTALGKFDYLLNAGRAKKIAREYNPDIVHAHFATSYGYWGSRLKEYPLVISCHGSDIMQSAQKGILSVLVKNNLQQADKLIVPSVFLKDQIMALGVDLKSEPELIQFGVDLAETGKLFQRRTNDMLTNEAPKLLFFKHHRNEYGPEVALKAFRKIKSVVTNASLVMAGHGPLTEELRNLAVQLGLADSVSFPGFIPTAEALSYVSQHTLMLMPTIVQESFGVSAMEAAAVGVPVVASRVGGVPEIVRDNQTGFLVPPNDAEALADAVCKILSDTSLLQQMSQNSRRMIEQNFNWPNKVDQLEALYQSLL